MKSQEVNFKFISNTELLTRLENLVRSERKITHFVLIHIAEIETRKLFADLGFDSMYTYLTRGLGYSESAAYRRLQSARLLRQVPELAEKIENGSLNLTQLSQVQKCLRSSKSSGEDIPKAKTLEILNKLENKSTFSTEKILAQELDFPIQTYEKVLPQKDDSIRLELTITSEQFIELEQAKSLLSHICPEGSWAKVIATLAKHYNQKKLGKLTQHNTAAKSLAVKGQKAVLENREDQAGPNVLAVSKNRKTVPLRTRRMLLKKAEHCCEYQNPITKHRCNSKFQLEVDHRQPVALGGSDNIDNLRILCRTHNALSARRARLTY